MALTYRQLECIRPLVHGATVLSLGYPDILVLAEGSGLPEAPTANIHGDWRPLVSTRAVFSGLGAKIFDCIDYFPDTARGERFVDLNQPLTLEESCKGYDLVIDPGTTEHCANVWQALVNATHYVGMGGHIVHILCTDGYMNHGFYQVQPTFFCDYYNENAWEIKMIAVDKQATTELHVFNPDMAWARPDKKHWEFGEYMVWAIAQRKQCSTVGKLPIQTKYKRKEALNGRGG